MRLVRMHGRRRRGQAGFTFVELLMTIAITASFSLALYGAFIATVEMSRGHESQARAQADGRTTLDRFSRDVRQAVSADAGLTVPIESLGPAQIVMYVDSTRDASAYDPRPFRVRYRVDGDRLLREQATPIGATAPYTYGAYGPEEVLLEGLVNGAVPVFTAVTTQGVAMPATVNPPFSRDIAQVGIRIRVAGANGNDLSQPTELTTDVALRNVITL